MVRYVGHKPGSDGNVPLPDLVDGLERRFCIQGFCLCTVEPLDGAVK